MKKLLLFIFSIIIIFSIGCKKINYVHLSGEIKHPKTNYIVLFIDAFKDTILLKNGRFDTLIEVPQKGLYLLKHYRIRNYIYLYGAKALTIRFDTRNVDSTLQFSGSLAPENQCIIDINSYTKHNKLDYYEIQPEVFDKKADSIYNLKLIFFNNYLKNNSHLDTSFITLQKASLKYEFYSASIDQAINFKLDNSVAKVQSNAISEREDYLVIPSYIEFLINYIYLKAEEIAKSDSSLLITDYKRVNTYFKAIDLYIKNKKIKDKLLFEITKDELSYLGIKNFGDNYAYFNNLCNNELYKNEINKIYQYKSSLLPGKEAPAITCINAENIPVKLKEFSGKYIMIEFWATWCSYCRKELPEYIKLQEQFRNRNIVFISISLDDDFQNWKKFIGEEKNNSIKLFGGDGFNSAAAISYQVNGIPTFVLINREGKIIDSQAPRPSSEEIKKILNELPGI